MNRYTLVYILSIAMGVLAACAPSTEQVTAETSESAATVAASWTETPTATQAPPTSTPTATVTPPPTQTPEPTPFGGSGRVAFLAEYRYQRGRGALLIYDFETAELITLSQFSLSYTYSADGSPRSERFRPPIWSPDAQHIAFAHGGLAYVISAQGGHPVQLTGVPDESVPWSLAFSPGGQFVSASAGGDIYVANADGSGVLNITSAHDRYLRSDKWSPDGNSMLAYGKTEEEQRAADSLHLISSDGESLTNLTHDPDADYFNASWTSDGRILFASTKPGSPDIYFVDPARTELENVTAHAAIDINPQLSPDGARIAFASSRTEGNCWPDCIYTSFLMNSDGSDPVQFGGPGDRLIEWSPDGTYIALLDNLWRIPKIASADGSEVNRLSVGAKVFEIEWSPDSKQLLFLGRDVRLHYVPIEGDRQPHAITSTDEIFAHVGAWAPIP